MDEEVQEEVDICDILLSEWKLLLLPELIQGQRCRRKVVNAKVLPSQSLELIHCDVSFQMNWQQFVSHSLLRHISNCQILIFISLWLTESSQTLSTGALTPELYSSLLIGRRGILKCVLHQKSSSLKAVLQINLSHMPSCL